MVMINSGLKLKSHDATMSRVVTKMAYVCTFREKRGPKGTQTHSRRFIAPVGGVTAPEQGGGGIKSTNW